MVRRYQAKFAKSVPEHLKVCHILLTKFGKQTMLSYIFIHIIQIAFFSSEYLLKIMAQLQEWRKEIVHILANKIIYVNKIKQILGHLKKLPILVQQYNKKNIWSISSGPLNKVITRWGRQWAWGGTKFCRKCL